MRWRRLLGAATIVAAVLGTSAGGAGAAGPAPLKASLFLVDPPADLTYDAVSETTPIALRLRVENVSGAPVTTTEGFQQTEFWRRLYFTDPVGGIITNVAEETSHRDARVGFCLSRDGLLQSPTAIPVVPVEVLEDTPQPDGPARFVREYLIEDARLLFELTRSGRHTAQVKFSVMVIEGGAGLITNCDQFPQTVLIDVRGGVPGRQEYEIVSNAVEFRVRGLDSTPPVTTATLQPAPVDGWHRGDAALELHATDDPDGAGVAAIVTSTSGAQSGEQTFEADTGSVLVVAEGITTVRFHAVDAADNREFEHAAQIRIDRTPPTLSLAPASGPHFVNAPLTVSLSASDALSGVAPGSPRAVLTMPGAAPVSVGDGSTVTLSRVGTTSVVATAVDVAGNPASPVTASYAVTYRFGGFAAPLTVVEPTAVCTAGCPVFKYGSAVTVSFKLADHGHAVVSTAAASIAVEPVSGPTALAPTRALGAGKYGKGNAFLYDKRLQAYVFDINTRSLTAGDWRIAVTLDDGTVRHALMRLQ